MSRTDTWMPIYIGDYLRDTGHLSAAEHGAYFLLLMQAWTRGGSLPADENRLRNLARLDVEQWQQSSATILEFFTLEGDSYTQKRLMVELANAQAITEKRSKAGKISAAVRADQQTSNKNPTHVEHVFNTATNTSPTNTPTQVQQTGRPSPSPSPSEKKEDSVLRTDASASGLFPIDARQVLWSEGLAQLRQLTGHGEGKARALLGKLCKEAGDDCSAVSRALGEATSLRPGDPVGWLTKAVKAVQTPRNGFIASIHNEGIGNPRQAPTDPVTLFLEQYDVR